MKERKRWAILDVLTTKFLYGINGNALLFSTREIADEVAEQFFETRQQYLLVNLGDTRVNGKPIV